MEDHLRGNNVVEGNTVGAPHQTGSTESKGDKFATTGGAFVVPATGKPGVLIPSAANGAQRATSAPVVVPPMAAAHQVLTGKTPANDKDSQTSSSKKKPKKDRSKLRKGKWTPEEEEYTSRIIHYFSTGILTLPEGTTLRAYLAEKLNCDPMRITKKYAGASCLGKRVYHLCDRAPPTATDVEVAKAELAQLEQRFRLRVEHGQSGMPLPPRTDFLPGATNMFNPLQMNGLLQNLATAGAPGAYLAAAQTLTAATATAPGAYLAPAPVGGVAAPGVGAAPVGAPGAAWPVASLPLVAPNALIPGAVPGLPVVPPNVQNNPLAVLAYAQAATALNQLAAANLQQQHQELQRAFESQLQAAAQQPVGTTCTSAPAPPPAPMVQNVPQPRVNPAPAAPQAAVINGTGNTAAVQFKPSNGGARTSTSSSPRSKEDEDAGSMLMGFLSSLRKGYEEALSEREKTEGPLSSQQSGHKRRGSDTSQASSKRPRLPSARTISNERAETASGTTSYPAESSLEDSDEAGKGSKQDPSSSEDSDKDYSERDSGERGSSSGEGGSVPPRKRMKGKRATVGEFTTKNVAEHNHRMDVMRSRSPQGSLNIGSRWPRDERTGLDD